MNAEERNPAQERELTDDKMATGQASYGNSGDTGVDDSTRPAQNAATLDPEGTQNFASDGQGATSDDPTPEGEQGHEGRDRNPEAGIL